MKTSTLDLTRVNLYDAIPSQFICYPITLTS